MLTLRRRTAAVLAAILVAVGTLLPTQASANDASVARAADWIASTWEQEPGKFFTAGTISDGIIALSAADSHPETVTSMLTALNAKAPGFVEDNPAGLAKVIIALDASNQNARYFLGPERDLGAELVSYLSRDDYSVRGSWAPHLIVIALARLGEPIPQVALDNLLATQRDGAFGYAVGDTFIADPDYTGIGLSALVAVKNLSTDAEQVAAAERAITEAAAWANDPANQKTDAAGNYYWATYSSANATGMVAGGLAEAGYEVTKPTQYLKDQQALTGVGAWSNVPDGTNGDVMATTQAILGVAGISYGTVKSTQLTDMVEAPESPAPSPSPSGSPNPEDTPTAPASPDPDESPTTEPGDPASPGQSHSAEPTPSESPTAGPSTEPTTPEPTPSASSAQSVAPGKQSSAPVGPYQPVGVGLPATGV